MTGNAVEALVVVHEVVSNNAPFCTQGFGFPSVQGSTIPWLKEFTAEFVAN